MPTASPHPMRSHKDGHLKHFMGRRLMRREAKESRLTKRPQPRLADPAKEASPTARRCGGLRQGRFANRPQVWQPTPQKIVAAREKMSGL